MLLALPRFPAQGQEADELIEEATPLRFGLIGDGGFVYQGDADLDDGGSVQVNRYDFGAFSRFQITDQLRLSNSYFFGVGDYDFHRLNPWETILSLRLVSRLTYMFTERWGITGGGIFMFSPETLASWGKSFSGGGLVAGEYQHSENLSVSLGVGVISQIEDDAAITPSVGLRWTPGRWAVRVGGVPASGGSAAAAEVSYRIIDPIELGLGAVYQQRRFRLDRADGVGEDNSLPVRVRLAWHIDPSLSLNLLAGVAVAGEVRVEDRDGRRVGRDDYDPAPYIGARLVAGI
jgi:hypothetical protein